ncbi:MAG: DUF998 domain-containing protein [Firmicutes bacterium]|nr:DUF998 domain-containing protein [Bacillota bacterium]
MKKYHKLFPLTGILGVIFYFIHILIGTALYEGYNSFAQAISDLTATNSPSRQIASIFSLLYGIFSVIFTLGLFIYFKGKLNKIITIAIFIFSLMNIISFFGYTLFPLTEAGYAGTFQDIMHMVVTVLVVMFTIVSIILLTIGFFQTRQYMIMGSISLCTFIFLITGAMLINILPSEYFGVAQRINVFSVVIYTGVLAIFMHKYIKREYKT